MTPEQPLGRKGVGVAMDSHGIGPNRIDGAAVLGCGAPVLVPDLEREAGG